MNKRKRKALKKISFVFTAILLISLGVSTLLKGKLHYFNYWGGAVFAPIAILVGVLLLVLLIFKWEKFR